MSDFYITPEDFEEAAKNGISEKTLKQRVYVYRWDKQRAIRTPLNKISDERKKYREIAKTNGISLKIFRKRVNSGWSLQDASTIPPMTGDEKRKKSLEIRKKKRPFTEEQVNRAAENGISYSTLFARVMRRGWDIETAIITPVLTQKQLAERAKAADKMYLFRKSKTINKIS